MRLGMLKPFQAKAFGMVKGASADKPAPMVNNSVRKIDAVTTFQGSDYRRQRVPIGFMECHELIGIEKEHPFKITQLRQQVDRRLEGLALR